MAVVREDTARGLILETIETQPVSPMAPKGSLKDLLGLLKTDSPPPNDDECRSILEKELDEEAPEMKALLDTNVVLDLLPRA